MSDHPLGKLLSIGRTPAHYRAGSQIAISFHRKLLHLVATPMEEEGTELTLSSPRAATNYEKFRLLKKKY